jgi:hypothetical protein
MVSYSSGVNGMVRIVVHRFGDIEENFVEDVLEIVNDCYNNIDAHVVEIVDIHLFDKSSLMNAFVSEEKRKFGIETSGFEISFFAAHDAWHGTPRIMVAYDKMLSLPRLVGIGGLRHEVAHTVLHGSLEYYSFPMPICLLELKRKNVISRQMTRDLLYLVSIVAKDFEVTRLLYKKGYVEDQVAYNKYFLEPSEDDCESWNLAQNNESARVLVLVSILKTTCCAAPLLKDEKHGEEINEFIVRAMSYLPSEWSTCLMELVRATSEFGQNTHENVNLFVKRIIGKLVL